jgi:hypothetical protein
MREPVALLCPEPRLRRILRLALDADGFAVSESPDPSVRLVSPVLAVVADLDSLRWSWRTVTRRLVELGAESSIPLLLISVVPIEPDHVGPNWLLDTLQPPFAPGTFIGRLRGLLARAEVRSGSDVAARGLDATP